MRINFIAVLLNDSHNVTMLFSHKYRGADFARILRSYIRINIHSYIRTNVAELGIFGTRNTKSQCVKILHRNQFL